MLYVRSAWDNAPHGFHAAGLDLRTPAPSPRPPADIGDWTYCFDISHMYCKAARCCNIMLDHVQFLIGETNRIASWPGDSRVPGKQVLSANVVNRALPYVRYARRCVLIPVNVYRSCMGLPDSWRLRQASQT